MNKKVRLTPAHGLGGAVAAIELISPESGNTIDFTFADELLEAVESIDQDTQCVTLTAEGKNFCLGGDLSGFASAESPGEFVGELAIRLHQALVALRELSIPIVIGAQGWSAGAGMSLAFAGDICVVEQSSKFRTAYGAVGLTPDGGMSWTLPRAVGRAVAMDLLLTQRVLGSEEALQLGAVSRVVTDGEAGAVVEDIARSIAGGPANALRSTKILVEESISASFSSHLDAEAEAIALAAAGDEGREGVRAFQDRRSPSFTSINFTR